MTIRDLEKVVSHWKTGATSDLRSTRLLFAGKQYLPALFFCHLAIEKTLKAMVVHESREHAPYVHNLIYLAGKTALTLSKEQLTFLELMNRFNIEGRYPSQRLELRKELTRAFVATQVKTTEGFIKWCQSHL